MSESAQTRRNFLYLATAGVLAGAGQTGEAAA